MFGLHQKKLNERDIALEEAKWRIDKNLIERKQAIMNDKAVTYKKTVKKPSTSKLLIMFLFGSCTLIELFTGWVTVQSIILAREAFIAPDFTPLVTLIGAVVAEVFGFAVYSLKSTKENTAGGIVFEQAMHHMNNGDNNNAVG